jgi:hypothetical protein
LREDGTRSVSGAVVGDSELGKKKGEWRLFLALWFWERKNQRISFFSILDKISVF